MDAPPPTWLELWRSGQATDAAVRSIVRRGVDVDEVVAYDGNARTTLGWALGMAGVADGADSVVRALIDCGASLASASMETAVPATTARSGIGVVDEFAAHDVMRAQALFAALEARPDDARALLDWQHELLPSAVVYAARCNMPAVLTAALDMLRASSGSSHSALDVMAAAATVVRGPTKDVLLLEAARLCNHHNDALKVVIACHKRGARLAKGTLPLASLKADLGQALRDIAYADRDFPCLLPAPMPPAPPQLLNRKVCNWTKWL